MTNVWAAALALVFVVGCKTTTCASGKYDGYSLENIDVPGSLVGTPLEVEAKACVASYRSSMGSCKTTAGWTQGLTIATAVSVAAAALATGMSATVKSEAAKQNWTYVGVGAAATIPLAAGLNLWVNGDENARQARAAAWQQSTHLFNAGHLMTCVDEGMRKQRAAIAGQPPPPPEPAFCQDEKGKMKPPERLRDEAHRELLQCLTPAIWAYGPPPAASEKK